jgi:S1-C subfamily serine protease
MIPPAGTDLEKETPKKTENNNSQSADDSDLPDLTIEEIEEKLKPSVVKIICYDYDGTTEISQGSGFFIDDKGTFITNAHVIKNCYYMKITTYFGMTYDVDVMYVYNGTNSDYAICRASERQVSQPVEFVESAMRFDKVYALGYPNGTFSINTTEGEIVSREAVEGSKHYYANTATIDHGSSGGVLVDTKGRVLGITTGSFAEGGYVALKYQDFKDDVEKKHTGGKAPGKYFHDFEDYTFDSSTMDKYFDIYVNVLS